MADQCCPTDCSFADQKPSRRQRVGAAQKDRSRQKQQVRKAHSYTEEAHEGTHTIEAWRLYISNGNDQCVKQLFINLFLWHDWLTAHFKVSKKMELVADGGESKVGAARKEGPHAACSKQDWETRNFTQFITKNKTTYNIGFSLLYFLIILGLSYSWHELVHMCNHTMCNPVWDNCMVTDCGLEDGINKILFYNCFYR